MKKAAGSAAAILKGILFIGFSIQIILGIVWLSLNISRPQVFTGNWGSIYRMLGGLAGQHSWVLYIVQLAAAYYAAHRFLGRFGRTDLLRDIWRCLAMLTFPMAMQCHLAVSPYSLVSSLFLLELSAVLPKRQGAGGGETAGEREKTGFVIRLAQGGACWFFLTLLLPEYFILGVIPLLLALLFELPGLLLRPRRLGVCLLLLAAFGGMTAGTCRLTEGGGYLPNRESAAFSIFHRTAWPSLWADHENWPDQVRSAVEEYVWTASLHADDTERILAPVMLEEFGEERAAGYYLKMAAVSWKKQKSWTIRQIGWDALGYGVTPLILPLQLSGTGYASYSGRNYEFMFMYAPKVAKYYVGYSCWWFAVMLPTAALLSLALLIKEPGRLKARELLRPLFCLLWAGMVVAAYTMRGAGRMDYKCTVGVNLLWLCAALLLHSKETAAGETGSGRESGRNRRELGRSGSESHLRRSDRRESVL